MDASPATKIMTPLGQSQYKFHRGFMHIKDLFDMAPELNSTNSNQFCSQTPQLQNSMEQPKLWSCSANRLRVLEHLFRTAPDLLVLNLDVELKGNYPLLQLVTQYRFVFSFPIPHSPPLERLCRSQEPLRSSRPAATGRAAASGDRGCRRE